MPGTVASSWPSSLPGSGTCLSPKAGKAEAAPAKERSQQGNSIRRKTTDHIGGDQASKNCALVALVVLLMLSLGVDYYRQTVRECHVLLGSP